MSDTLTTGATEAAADIPDYPMERDARCPFAPPPQVLEMGEAKPLSRVRIWDGSTPWLITGHEVARELFADSARQRRRPARGFPHWNEHMLSTVNKRPRSVFTSDAEEHTRFRRMLSKPFTFKRVEGLRSAIQEVTDECIDAILAGPQPADIVTKLALPVPTKVISEMLGVPYEDHEFFQHHANVGLARYASAEDGQKGAMSLSQVPDRPRRDQDGEPRRGCGVGPGRAGQRRRDQRQGSRAAGYRPVDRRARDHRQHDRHRHAGPAGEPRTGCAAAGFRRSEVHRQRRRGADALPVDHPERPAPGGHRGHRDRWRDDPRRRGHHPRPGPRELGCGRLSGARQAGPARDAGQQLGFGYGRHQCVGQQLARAELQIVFHTLLRRIPTLRLAVPFDEVPFKHDRLAYGVYELPVTW